MKMKLTQALANKYQIPSDLNVKQQELVDEGGTGLYLLVTKSGMKTFYLRYRSAQNGNKTAHIKLGRADDITLEQARHKVKLLRAEIAQGNDPQAEVKNQRNELTYSEYMENHYFPYISPRRRVAEQYRRLYESKLKPEFGGIKISAITKRQIQSFHSRLHNDGFSNAYCNRFIQLIKASINVGINIIEVIHIKNPAVGIPLFDEEGRERFLSNEELSRLIPVLLNAEAHFIVPAKIIRFLLATGLRIGECFHCQWAHIENKTLSIPASHAKSKRLDSIPLNAAAIAVLSECDKSKPYPFANPATGKPYVSIKKSFKALMNRANLNGVTAHTCRHTAASLMINGGQSLYSVQRILRHSSSRVTEKYAHLSTQTLQGASDTISDQLLAASGKS